MNGKEIEILKNAVGGPTAPVPKLNDISSHVLTSIQRSRPNSSLPLTILPLAGIAAAASVLVAANAWITLTDPLGDLFTQLILVMR
jgi:hypothetical protein